MKMINRTPWYICFHTYMVRKGIELLNKLYLLQILIERYSKK